MLFMQAESAIDQIDWIEKITGVIASLLNSQSPEQVSNGWPLFGLHVFWNIQFTILGCSVSVFYVKP